MGFFHLPYHKGRRHRLLTCWICFGAFFRNTEKKKKSTLFVVSSSLSTTSDGVPGGQQHPKTHWSTHVTPWMLFQSRPRRHIFLRSTRKGHDPNIGVTSVILTSIEFLSSSIFLSPQIPMYTHLFIYVNVRLFIGVLFVCLLHFYTLTSISV